MTRASVLCARLAGARKRELALYARLVGARLRGQLQDPASLLLDAAGSLLVTALEFGAIALVLTRVDGLGGWELREVALLFGTVEIAFGIMDAVFAGFDPRAFGEGVRRGDFDRVMLRPAPLMLQVFGHDLALRRVGKIAVGGAILAVALPAVAWTPLKVAFLPLVVAGMVLYFGGLFVIGSTITFWTVESIEAMNALTYGGRDLVSYPMTIYGDALRRTFTFVLPAAFLNYYPALWLLGRPDPFGLPPLSPALAPLAGAAVFALALAFWRFGVRHYRSTGT